MKKNLRWIMCLACLLVSGCGRGDVRSGADYIGIEAAKEAALKEAGIPSGRAEFQSAGLDSKNGIFFYQVVFTDNDVEYQYGIDALTGAVIEESRSSAEKEGEPEESKEPSQAPAGGGGLSADWALAAALSHAGLTEKDISFSKVEADMEDGQEIFEVEFILPDGTEYDYELSRADGSVLSFDFDAEAAFPKVPVAGTGIISEDEAKQAVIDRIPGAAGENVYLHLEEDDGRLEYEGWIFYDNTEYEFKIDAYSGGVMEWEAEMKLP